MKKLASIIALLFFLAGCSNIGNMGISAVSVPRQPVVKLSDYFPFTKDIHLKYKGTGNEYAEFETYVDFIKNDKIQLRKINAGTVSVNVYQLKDGVLKKTFSQGETYYRYDYTSFTNQDEIIIKEPLKVGTAWTLGDGAQRSITAVNQTLKVGLRSFKIMAVTTKRQGSVVTDYYAKGIGLVKTEFSTGGSNNIITSELEKAEKNVPYIQSVRFYYPEFMKDRVAYIDKDIEIKTNQNVKIKLQIGLKEIPLNSGLSKTLSTKARVLGVKIDKNTGIVTVDFNSKLVTEMNAGTTLESMILKSITNTFGDYYQTDKVIITIEGKPYESGHVLMKPGEYFTVNKNNVKKYENP